MADDSTTDTYVAARLWIDNDRWRDVPFLLRTGKRLAFSEQRVSLIMREPNGTLDDAPRNGNVLSFDLSGDGAIGLSFVAKRPGPELHLETADVKLSLDSLADGDPLPPYVRLIHDVLIGDRSLFTRPDGLAAVWEAAGAAARAPAEAAALRPGLVGAAGRAGAGRARRLAAGPVTGPASERLAPCCDGSPPASRTALPWSPSSTACRPGSPSPPPTCSATSPAAGSATAAAPG